VISIRAIVMGVISEAKASGASSLVMAIGAMGRKRSTGAMGSMAMRSTLSIDAA
jgi:hypothetical protein